MSLRLPLLTGAALLALAVPASAGSTPELIQLPGGYQPEGIAKYDGNEVLVGSIPTGALTRANVKTGELITLSPPTEGRSAIGVKVADGRVYVAGGQTGKVRVQDAQTGAVIREEQAGTLGSTFVNDVVVSKGVAYFTDSRAPKVYALPVDGGPLRTITLTGSEFVQAPAGTNSLNGIVAAKGFLVAVSQGVLFRIDPETGDARRIDLGGAVLTNGDGLLLKKGVLSVVQNRLNQIAQVELSKNLLTGRIVRTLTDPDFQVPTTVTHVQGRLYAVNARFGTAATPETRYDVVKVDGSSKQETKGKKNKKG